MVEKWLTQIETFRHKISDWRQAIQDQASSAQVLKQTQEEVRQAMRAHVGQPNETVQIMLELLFDNGAFVESLALLVCLSVQWGAALWPLYALTMAMR